MSTSKMVGMSHFQGKPNLGIRMSHISILLFSLAFITCCYAYDQNCVTILTHSGVNLHLSPWQWTDRPDKEQGAAMEVYVSHGSLYVFLPLTHRLWLAHLLLRFFPDLPCLFFGYYQSCYDSHAVEIWNGKLVAVDCIWGVAESEYQIHICLHFKVETRALGGASATWGCLLV